MADLLDYGAPEQSEQAQLASETASENAPVASQPSVPRGGTSLLVSENQLVPQQPDDGMYRIAEAVFKEEIQRSKSFQ